MTTCINLSIAILFIIGSLFLWGLFLRLGLRWAKVTHVTTKHVVAATLISMVMQIAVMSLFRVFGPAEPSLAMEFGQVASSIFAVCAGLTIVFEASFWQAFRAWLVTLVPGLGSVLLLMLVIHPYVLQSYKSPSNAMAPSLLGPHLVDTCPSCSRPCYRTPDGTNFQSDEAEPMICDAFHIHPIANPKARINSADRFIVSKYLRPKRWDIVIFRSPDEPTVLYCMRLVGLPGETILVKEGAVWANDKRLVPPDRLRGISYVAESPSPLRKLWGTEENPAVLGDGEYFMLGDFNSRARDSRYWEQGVPGHPPFAVPESDILGVVTQIYWPPSRWRVFQ